MSHHATYWDRVHGEHVVLDIGNEVGALVLYAAPSYRGREIEVTAAGDGTRRTHSAVLERRIAGHTVFAAVFPDLAAGAWTIEGGGPGLPNRVTIEGGAVAEVNWR